jgi:hypothetical protein
VLNAFDFLEKSVRELEKAPKYSVINFWAAVELFLKARLLREHWVLVVSKLQDAKFEGVRKSEFFSVTVADCFYRLRHIVNEPLTSHEEQCFKVLYDHRNKLIHFFHPEYVGPSNATLLEEIVCEQIKAWVYLHRLLTCKWQAHFVPYARKLKRLGQLIRRQSQFLSSKFKAIDPEIQVERKKGIVFEKCAACGFRAARITEVGQPLFSRTCLVCEYETHFLRVKCPNCQREIVFDAEHGGECAQCESSVDLDLLLSTLGPDEDPKEPRLIAYCSSCEHHEATAIPFGEDYLCLQCLELHASAGKCGWCGVLITGDTSGTFAWGCFRCLGPDLDRD